MQKFKKKMNFTILNDRKTPVTQLTIHMRIIVI